MTRKRIGESIQPCRTPDLTGNASVCYCVFEDDTAVEVNVEHLNKGDNLRWYSICLEDSP